MAEVNHSGELKPCPFCASTQGEDGVTMNLYQGGTIKFWYVSCVKCGATGGSTSDEQSAAEKWNGRA